jgi:hypothetical protein
LCGRSHTVKRSQRSFQARELIETLRKLDAAGVDGAFVFTFVSPISILQ